jgi:hypothetical protein
VGIWQKAAASSPDKSRLLRTLGVNACTHLSLICGCLASADAWVARELDDYIAMAEYSGMSAVFSKYSM